MTALDNEVRCDYRGTTTDVTAAVVDAANYTTFIAPVVILLSFTLLPPGKWKELGSRAAVAVVAFRYNSPSIAAFCVLFFTEAPEEVCLRLSDSASL